MNSVDSEKKVDRGPERTFQYQDSLPSLPVPELRRTLDKYLDSVRVHAQPDEYERTKRIVDEFERGIGSQLHELLLERAKRERNWLELWWENVYHQPRYPILPLVNFGGSSLKLDIWPPNPRMVLQRSAVTVYWLVKYWDLIRKEQLPVHNQRGTRWCMNQVHRLFNTCRIPGQHKDELKFSFKSVYEGDCPSHIVVMYRGLFWRVDVLNPATGDVYTAPQLEASFEEIRRLSEAQDVGVPIGALTCLDRTDWFQERQRLLVLSPENAHCLNVIEESICLVSFTDDQPANESAAAYQTVCPSPLVSWADKNLVLHVHKNGVITENCDHSYLDAIIVIHMNAYIDSKLMENGYQWKGDLSRYPCPRVVQLNFKTDKRTVAAVSRAMDIWRNHAEAFDVMLWHHTAFGTDYFKTRRVYGDTVVQLALQLAYLRLHHRPAPTYETASTRKYYHGRTETVRSCTPEAVDWAKSMLAPGEKVGQNRYAQWRKFEAAMQKHNRLMAEASNGEGCDRHLLALRILADDKGLPVPDIFTDSSWKKSGGDGNFIISSSFIGYSSVWGGCLPMCVDGYGTFYKMQSGSITFYLTTWKSSRETNLSLWRDSLEYSLTAIKNLIDDWKTQSAKY